MNISVSISSIGFLLYTILVALFYFLSSKKNRYIVLGIASIIYLFIASKFYSIFVFLSAATIYFGGISISKIEKEYKEKPKEERKQIKADVKKKKKTIMFIIVCINILILAILKYYNVTANALGWKALNILMPIGISYYTLEAISYIVDISRGKYEADTNFLHVLLYLTFFPKMTLGPIGKYDKLKDTLFEGIGFSYERIRKAFLLIIYGYFKKMVIADRFGMLVNHIYKLNLGGYNFIVLMIAYTVQLYMEFSGCIDIVRGVGEIFGIGLDENFRQPFFSQNVQEFWRRWHITLGAWLKEYVFYPVSISKVNMNLNNFANKKMPKFLAKFVTIAFPLFFVWVVNGIWHGAGFKYLLYGMYYYVIMMIGVFFKPLIDFINGKFKIDPDKKIFKLFRIIRTIILVMIGNAIFKAPSMMYVYTKLTSGYNEPMNVFTDVFSKKDLLVGVIFILIVFIVSVLKELNIDVREKVEKSNILIRWPIYYFILLSVVIFGIYGAGYNPEDFIYGGF